VSVATTALEQDDQGLENFAQRVLDRHVGVETLSAFEHRVHWSDQGNSLSLGLLQLRSGITVTAMRCSWERSFAVGVRHPPSLLQFDLTRGPSTKVATDDGEIHMLGGGTFQIGQVKRAVGMRCGWDERTKEHSVEQLSLAIDGERLRELLGAKVLPAPLERILLSNRAYPREAHGTAPALFRLLDEIIHADGRGLSRQLHLEAKGLEFLAALIDQLEESEGATAPRLSRSDVERLERARQILLARLQDPPSLPALARQAGLNEVKLKVGFRALFGSPVYAYLRDHRLELAHRLLRARVGNVTEVAQRVGYANPSKFATAFRKRFNVSPSDV
jgi:AraC-like DNA-binding protein